MGNSLSSSVNLIAPIFIITSPITSYADQIYQIHRTRSSAGLSLDIPLIMLVSSILKLFYWVTVHYSLTLLAQAILTVIVQVILLHVSLENRSFVSTNVPFEGEISSSSSIVKRPYNFWRWRSSTKYWRFLAYYTAALAFAQVLIAPFFAHADPTSYKETAFSSVQALVALSVESILPVPQLIKNAQARSCAGFRLSLCASWLLGDAMKLWWFFLQPRGSVPLAFKLCAMFQLVCDSGLAVQFLIWGTDKAAGAASGLNSASSSVPSTPALGSLLVGINRASNAVLSPLIPTTSAPTPKSAVIPLTDVTSPTQPLTK